MEITIETLKELAKQYPNNQDLGGAVRKITWKAEEVKEQINSTQISIFETIEENGNN